jgi:hypothetical protein
MYNVGARPLKVRLRAGSTKEGENQRPPKTRHYRTYYSYRYVGSLYSVGEHHYIANTISCSDVLGLGRAITTSYHDELSRRAITTSYHDEIDASGPRVLVILLDRLSNQLTTTVSYTVQMHR